MSIQQEDPRFEVQQIGQQEWVEAGAANAAADYLAGYREVTETFLKTRWEPELKELEKNLESWDRDDVAAYVEENKKRSLIMLVMMLTGACNADCEICFTDRRRKPDELEPDQRDRVLRQARELGARFVYVPGEGEPTIDSGFWQFLDTCREIGLHAVMFTNGILFSDPASCQKYWGMQPDEALRRLAGYPVSFYHKLWTTQPGLLAEMLGLPERLCPYSEHDGTAIPTGLMRMMDILPRERVGVEVVVEKRNAEEVAEKIIPFATKHDLARIVEMIQHNGRTFGDGSFDPSLAQSEPLLPFLSPTSCSLAICKAVVTTRGYLSPRIAVLENQIPGEPVDVRTGDFFDLLHSTDYVVKRRYDINTCLCEQIPMELAQQQMSSTVQRPVTNVQAPAIAATETPANP